MKKFLSILFISFYLATPSQANDIKDFQIEGMGYGESLLDYFDKELIDKEKNSIYSMKYKNNEYVQIGASYKKDYALRIASNTYDDLSIILKTDDDTYKIYSIGGRNFCKDIAICKSLKKKIETDLKNLFGKTVEISKDDKNHSADITGNSKTYNTYFQFNSGAYILVAVYDWSESYKNNGMTFLDNLKVVIVGPEFDNFLQNVQYK